MADCKPLDFICKAGEGLGNLADNAITDFVKSIYEGAVAFVAQVSTFWMNSPSPDVANGAVVSLRADMSWYVAGFAILGFLMGLIRLLTSQDVKASLIGIATPIANLILATAAYATGIGLLLSASDAFSKWIIQRSTSGDVDLTQMLTASSALLSSPGTAFILYILLLLGAIINLLFMYFRDVMFLILSAFIVALAAASGSEQGRQAWRKANGWLVALLLFKPVAAGIYSLGFRMLVSGSSEEGENTSIPEAMHSTLIALLILLLAALALPALIKFIVPAAGVGAGAFSGGGALGAGVTLAAGAAVLATGGAGAVAGGASTAARGAGAGASAASSAGSSTAGGANPNSGPGASPPGSGGGSTGGGSDAPSGSTPGSGGGSTGGGTEAPSGSTPGSGGGTTGGGTEAPSGSTPSSGGGNTSGGSDAPSGSTPSSDGGTTGGGSAAPSGSTPGSDGGTTGGGSAAPSGANAPSAGGGKTGGGSDAPSGANAPSASGGNTGGNSAAPSGSTPKRESAATQKMSELNHLANGANPSRLVEEGDE